MPWIMDTLVGISCMHAVVRSGCDSAKRRNAWAAPLRLESVGPQCGVFSGFLDPWPVFDNSDFVANSDVYQCWEDDASFQLNGQ